MKTSGPVNLFQPPDELPYWPYPGDRGLFPVLQKTEIFFPVIAYRVCMARTKTSVYLEQINTTSAFGYGFDAFPARQIMIVSASS